MGHVAGVSIALVQAGGGQGGAGATHRAVLGSPGCALQPPKAAPRVPEEVHSWLVPFPWLGVFSVQLTPAVSPPCQSLLPLLLLIPSGLSRRRWKEQMGGRGVASWILLPQLPGQSLALAECPPWGRKGRAAALDSLVH